MRILSKNMFDFFVHFLVYNPSSDGGWGSYGGLCHFAKDCALERLETMNDIRYPNRVVFGCKECNALYLKWKKVHRA